LTNSVFQRVEPENLAGNGMQDGMTGASRHQRVRVLLLALGLLITVGLFEWYFKLEFSLGVFYIFPVMTGAMVLSRGPVLVLAAFCAWFRAFFVPELAPIEYWLRFLMAFLAYSGAGLLVCEVNRNRRRLSAAFTRLKYEQQMRHQAEHQLRILVDSSPAAIVTLNSRTEVLAANRSAQEMLGFDSAGAMLGRSMVDYVPVFANALRASQSKRTMRTSTASWAKRADGTLFPVMTWFSTYAEGGETFLAGILVDVSEDVRERERENFRNIYYNNRLTASAVSHEVRNLCLALRVVASNLRKRPGMDDTPDFAALTTLIDNLTRLSSFELRHRRDEPNLKADVRAVLEQWHLIVEPDWNDVGGEIEFEFGAVPMMVHADSHALLQVLLNLSQNSLRAVQDAGEKKLLVKVRSDARSLQIDFIDSGPGISDATNLFRPFKEGSSGTGLGLYVSRNLARSFAGDLTFVPSPKGCHFQITLPLLEAAK
jgi:two-component system sensor kinase FixL